MTPLKNLAPEYVRAVSHPVRMAILAALFDRNATVAELAEAIDAHRATVSRHARVLEQLGLISVVPRQGVKTYRLALVPEARDDVWARAPTAAKEAMVGASLGTIHAAASAAAVSGGFDRGDMHLSRTPLTLDEEAWSYISREMLRLLGRIDEANARAAARVVRRNEHPVKATAVMMLFRNAPTPADLSPHGDEDRTEELTEDEALERALDVLEEVDQLRQEAEEVLTTEGTQHWAVRLIALAEELRVLGQAALAFGRRPTRAADARAGSERRSE